jgi:hypothetical protein
LQPTVAKHDILQKTTSSYIYVRREHGRTTEESRGRRGKMKIEERKRYRK